MTGAHRSVAIDSSSQTLVLFTVCLFFFSLFFCVFHFVERESSRGEKKDSRFIRSFVKLFFLTPADSFMLKGMTKVYSIKENKNQKKNEKIQYGITLS